MFWAQAPERFGNLGDLLAPVIIAALTGRRLVLRSRHWPGHRLISVDTIGQRQTFGRVHVWGAGFEGLGEDKFALPDDRMPRSCARFYAHATRGPFSEAILRRLGVPTSGIYGDPVWLLPRLWPLRPTGEYELGVVLHISEFDCASLVVHPPPYRRYEVPAELRGRVKLISLRCERNVDSLRRKVAEILSCRRIVSTSLHGLVIAEAYGIPCATFDFHSGDSGRFSPHDRHTPLDHRMRDFYAGAGCRDVLVLRRERHLETDWQSAIDVLNRHWQGPLPYDPGPLLGAFPVRFGPLLERPLGDPAVLESLLSLAPS